MEISLNNYNILLQTVQKTLGKTEQNITRTINREKVVMSWEIGKIISTHLEKNSGSSYGDKLFQQLAQDTSIDERVLYQMHNFSKAYPSLPKAEDNLSWSHYRNLVGIKDSGKRQYFEKLAIENGIGSDKLQKQIKQGYSKKPNTTNTLNSAESNKLNFQRGELFTYKIKNLTKPTAGNYIDCGFNVFTKAKNPLTGNDGDLISSVKIGDNFIFKNSTLTSKKLHTYKAYLEKIVDGDTIHVMLDLGFDVQHKEIIRLAKINAPESKTTQGIKSTKALTEILKDLPFLIVKTNKTDIYGRYVADIFFSENGEEDAQKVADEGIYLNQKLLDLGLVEIY